MPQMRDYSPNKLRSDFDWFCQTKPADFFGSGDVIPKSQVVIQATNPEKGIFFTSTEGRIGVARTYWLPNPLNRLFVPSSRLSTANNNPGFSTEYSGEGSELEYTHFNSRKKNGYGVSTHDTNYKMYPDQFDSKRSDSYHGVNFLTDAGSVQYEYWFNDGSFKELRMYFRHDSRKQDFSSKSVRASQLPLGQLQPGLVDHMNPKKNSNTVMRWDIEDGAKMKTHCVDKDILFIETQGPLVFDYKKILDEIIDPRIKQDPTRAPLDADYSWINFRTKLSTEFGFSAYIKDIVKEKELAIALEEIQKGSQSDYDDLPPLI